MGDDQLDHGIFKLDFSSNPYLQKTFFWRRKTKQDEKGKRPDCVHRYLKLLSKIGLWICNSKTTTMVVIL